MFAMPLTEVFQATFETFTMVFFSTLGATILGLPMGVLLFVTRHPNIWRHPFLHKLFTVIVNVMRSIPFIILMIALIPLTRFFVGTSIGTAAAIVPLTVAATPFVARLVEAALLSVPVGLVETGVAFGATPWQVVRHILLPEAASQIYSGLTVACIALVGFSAMAGVIGGGGLGDLAIRYGYQRFDANVMLLTVVILLVMVQFVQWVGDRIVKGKTK